MQKFDIAIIGGGHAGVEAAWISSQFDLKVLILSMPNVGLASTPCNPAVGGVGKGQVVREIDALGGLMGQLADQSAIQYRILNESKGYAVQSTRVQVDKDLYTKNAEAMIAANPNITVVKEKVVSVEKNGDQFSITTETSNFNTTKCIVTTGTFLNGKLHTGEVSTSGGRVDCMASSGMGEIFSSVQTLGIRFKTGTPARINKDSLDYSKFVEQKSDGRTKNFHSLNNPYERFVDQVSCYIAHTNERTLGIIRENKERSPIYNGQIKGVGPRYCPSIEDKAFRYPDRNSHHVFVEPEGLTANTIYPNGVSTSLPKEVQLEFLRTIEGFEECEIELYGYAVEYDVVDTSKLSDCLEYIDIPGLFFAGQVNGTSGYEEAAGQGLIAGANAALSMKGKDKLVLDRAESYIGVMVEDLISNKRDEPYRLFTARSENRLYVREDNSINRMAKYRFQMGLDKEIDKYQQEFIEEFELLLGLCKNTSIYATPENKEYFASMGYGDLSKNITLSELVRRSQLNPVETLEQELSKRGALFSSEVVYTCAVSIKYEGYINRSLIENERIYRLGRKKIDWQSIVRGNISNECRQRIEEVKPTTFSQLQRIDGIRPATLAFVAGNIVQ
ncbi:tRNA uridine-5-carboxymethylaminomethyl(34) synthesis enzyme MnmG [Halobacteriovorax marinus]|uniref:tRNA uridine-5-carboxymethylaminomethyl(34) synthesis enzyme MnmG n=1 Tax=Halobacteriovorax marinus TaxID=97084 RepID=UPI000BC300BB|nr:tRNA uridine-5-carboxymethylaminomethyl(34) synthesis enzyme MnmG [Halobacteriovorax marinus]ATH09446.1 tRNA uridine-5-carboxymethylaminomethyl(34) synthesis enzyme MnmG [Halobacteriovorax marinus]